MPQRPPIKAQQSSPAETLASLNLGYQGYADPTLCNPRQWSAANNCYSGPFGFVQRARFANIVTATGTTVSITSWSNNSNILTVNTSAPHGLSVGQRINLT